MRPTRSAWSSPVSILQAGSNSGTMTAMNPKPCTPEVRHLLRAAWFVLWVAAAAVARAQTGPIEDLATFPQDKLEISDGKKTKHVFQVWLANSPERQSQGLMFVRDLPDLRGMLFVHEQPRDISMWMKNTYIPLDMVFI